MMLSCSNLLRTFIVAVILIISSCKKEDKPVPDPPPPPVVPPVVVFTDVQVTASLQGRVIDESGKPVKDATIKSGNALKATDINGLFRFDNIQLGKNAGFVSVEKNGYFKTGRTFVTNASTLNYVEIKLIPQLKKGNFTSSAGGTINTGDGSSVSFEANSIINSATNSAYSGTVNVIASYLDPVSPSLFSIMPGNLMGLNTAGELKQLQTFGMLAVELEGAAGEKLNIAAGKTAGLTMPVPPSLAGNAPDTIPLWYFNDTTGLWKQQGFAVKQGGNYVGTVSHFSFWNCDVPQNFIRLTMTLKGQANQLLSRYKVAVTNTQTNMKAYGITDSLGKVSGYVPANSTLKLEVLSDCNTVLYTQDIGPYTTDKDLGEVLVTIPVSSAFTISGTVRNCSDSSVATGYVQVLLDGRYTVGAISNGTFSLLVSRCSSSPAQAVLYAVDTYANRQSDTLTVIVAQTDINIGNLRVCDIETYEYINFAIGNVSILFDPIKDSIHSVRNGNTTNLAAFTRAFDSLTYQYTNFSFNGIASAGSTHALDSFNFFVMKGFGQEYQMMGNTTVAITEYGAQGQFIQGSFNANYRETFTNTLAPGTCTFRVRRR